MKTISAKELDNKICLQYGLDTFNTYYALFGMEQPRIIDVTVERIHGLQEFQTQCFDKYISDCLLIYTYLYDTGIRGKVEIVR